MLPGLRRRPAPGVRAGGLPRRPGLPGEPEAAVQRFVEGRARVRALGSGGLGGRWRARRHLLGQRQGQEPPGRAERGHVSRRREADW